LVVVLALATAVDAATIGVNPSAKLLVSDAIVTENGDGSTVREYDIPLIYDEESGMWFIGVRPPAEARAAGDDILPWTLTVEGQFEVSASGILDPDPSISYGIAVTDFGAPSIFGFLFLTPIVPVPGPGIVSSSIVGGLTDFLGDGISISPSPGATLQAASVGPPLVNAGVDVGPGFAAGVGSPGSFYAYGPHADGPQAGPAGGPYTALQLELGFAFSGDGDTAALTGFASIIPVPEPSSYVLFILGVISLLGARRRWGRRSS
jgi:hypothetical protein